MMVANYYPYLYLVRTEFGVRSTKVDFSVRTSRTISSNNTSAISDFTNDCADDNEDVTGSDNDSGFTDGRCKDYSPHFKADDVIGSNVQRRTSSMFCAPLLIGQFYLYGYSDCSMAADVSSHTDPLVPVGVRLTNDAAAIIYRDHAGRQPFGDRCNALDNEEPVNLSVTCRTTSDELSCLRDEVATPSGRSNQLLTSADFTGNSLLFNPFRNLCI